MNMTIEQITAAYPNVAKLESQAGRELLAEVVGQMNALAAENAGLKAAAEFATAPDMWIEQADGMLDYRYVDWYVDVLKAAMETPSTDAAIANIRAQGVEMFVSKCKEESKRANSSDARDSWWVSGENADDFAAQLRQGAAL
jgi:hypothetical protein